MMQPTGHKTHRSIFALSFILSLLGTGLWAQSSGIVGDDTINKCETKSYTISIQNNSANPLTEMEISNNLTLLTGFAYVSSSTVIDVDGTPFCSQDPVITPGAGGGTLVWDIDSLCSGPFTLQDGETLNITFQLATDCTAVSASMNVDFAYLISGTPSSDSAAKSLQVLPGAVTIKKTPNVVAREVGQTVTWTLTIENTGLGIIENVAVSDVLGAGLQYLSSTNGGSNAGQTTTWDSSGYAALASMDPGDILTMDLTATVIACEGLDNSADVKWGCSPSVSCFDTATDGGTATASVERIVKTPLISFTPPDITFNYCQDYVDVSFVITNLGDGPAYNLRSIVDLSAFSISNVSSGASWDGSQFTLTDPIPAAPGPGNSYTLSFRVGYAGWCGGSFPTGDLLWQKVYQDGCGNDFYPPVELSQVNAPVNTPSVSISKNGAGSAIQIGSQVTYTITSSYAGPLSCGSGSTGLLTVVDTLPDGFTVIDAGGGTWIPGGGGTGGTITWTFAPPDSLSTTIILQSPDLSQCETYCFTLFTNSIAVSGTDCCGCALSASASETTAIECEELVDSNKSASPVTQELCENIQYTNTYDFGSPGILLSSLVFTDHAENQQEYVPGSLSVIYDGSDITACVMVTDTTPGAGGNLQLDFSACAPDLVDGKNLTIVYELTLTQASAAACSASSFYSWSTLDMGPTGSQCLVDGLIRETTVVSTQPPAMAVSVSGLGQIIDKCQTQTVTLTLTQTSAVANPRDVRLVLSGLNYYVVDPGAVVCGGGVSPTSCTPTIVGDDYVWYFGDTFSGSGQTATIQLDVQKRCSGLGNLDATAYFDDRCHDDASYDDTCSASGSETPALLLSGDLLIEKTPEVYYGTSNTAQWTIYVTNRGTGTAYNVWVDDVLGSGLIYQHGINPVSVSGDNTGVIVSDSLDHNGGAINGASIYIPQMTAGERRAISFIAAIVDCANLTNDVSTSWGCVGTDCQTVRSDSSTVQIPAPLLVHTNVVTNPVDACSAPAGSIVVRNAGQTTCYDVQLTETLPSGLVYVSGSTRYRVNSGGWIGPDPAHDPNPANSPLVWTSSEIPALAALDPGDTVELDFDFGADCPFQGGIVTIATRYENPCGQVFNVADSNFNVSFHEPVVTLSKTADKTIVSCGDTVTWTITVQNTSGYTLPLIWVEDTLDAAYSFVSSTGDPGFTADDGTQDGQVVSWEIRNLPHNATATLTLTATTDSSPCSPDMDNSVVAWWGCGAADGSSATKPGEDAPDNSLCLSSVSTSTSDSPTRRPDLGFLSIAMDPATIDSCNDSTALTIVLENTGSVDASSIDLAIDLPGGISFNSGSAQVGLGSDSASAIAALGASGDPSIAGSTITFYNIADKGSNLADLIEASGGNDTLALRFTVQSSCYTTQDVDFTLRFYDCCDDTQYSATGSQTLSSQYPILAVSKSVSPSSTDCGNNVSFTVTVQNTGSGNAQVVRVVDTLGAWLDYAGNFTEDVSGTVTPAIIGGNPQVIGWEFNDLAAGATATFSFEATLNPDGLPNQSNCSNSLRQNIASATWGCGTTGDAVDDNPNTVGYDCSSSTPANSNTVTVGMPNLQVYDINPQISCTSDGNFSYSVSARVRNVGNGPSTAGFTVTVSDGSWTGSGTYSGNLAAGANAWVTIDASGWNADCNGCTPYGLTAVVDLNNDVCECNESDNNYSENYTPSIPNLQVSTENYSISCTSDGNYRVFGTVTLRNAGCAGTLSSDIPVRFTLFSGTGCTGSQIDQWTQDFSGVSIAAGATQTFSLSARDISGNAVDDATSCGFSIRTEADYSGTICECDGSDNSLCSDETFTIPDLRVDSDTLSISCNADGVVRISGNVVVANDGCGANFTTNIPVRIRLYNDNVCSGTNGSFTTTFTAVNIPANGGTQTFSVNSTLSRNLCANSTGCEVAIGVELDYGATLCESDGTNNTYCSPDKPISIPDLQVSAEDLQVDCLADGQVRVSGDLTLQNSGCNATVSGNVAMRFTLFSNTGCTGTQLAQWTETLSGASIAAGSTQTFTISNRDITTHIVNNSTACQVSLRLEVDPGSTICECDGNNNSFCSAAKSVSVPDLRITAVTPSVSCTADGSLSGSVSVTVQNTGCGDASGVVVRLISDCGLTFSDQTIPNLGASSSTTLTFNFTPVASSCTCSFTATVDPDDSICEADGSDNALTSSAYTSPVPDLTVTDIDFSNLSCSGDAISGNVRVTIRNDGCGSASNFDLSLTTDGCLSFTTQTVTSLAASTSTTLTFNVTGAWADCSDGACVFTATVDSGGDICEYDGSNNSRSETYSNPLPDLDVTDIDFSNLFCSGDSLSGFVRVTVRNRGFGPATGFNVSLASDGCLNFSDQAVSATLGNGDSTTVDFSVSGTWADCTDCSCEFTATVDVDNDVCECDGTNNSRSETYSNPLPDLTVTAVATEIQCLGDGNLTGTTVTVQNRGCAPATNAVVRLVSDCGLTFSDQTVSLAAGETRTVFFGFTSGITGCTCTFSASIDPDNLICECDGTNNSNSGALDLSIPDLEVMSETLVLGCADDGQITVTGTVTLQNNGCGPNLSSDVPMRFTLYSGAGCSGTALAVWTQILSSVNLASAGGTQTFTIDSQTFPVDLCTVAGDCTVSIRIEADYDDSICEWDGNDNTLCSDKTHDCIDMEALSLIPRVLCQSDGKLAGTLTLTLRNSGGNPLERDFYIRVSDGHGWDVEQLYQADLGGTLPLPPGDEATLEIGWNRRFDKDLCQFTDIGVQLDSRNEYCQCSSENDQLSSRYLLSYPNLKVTAIEPLCAQDGLLRVRVRVENDGCGDAAAFSLSLRDSLGLQRTLNHNGLPREGSVWIDFENWPFGCEPGSLSFSAELDRDDNVCEMEDADNGLRVDYPLREPDLVLAGASANCQGDGTISFSGRVVNQGSGAFPTVTLYLYTEADRLLHSLTLPGNGGRESDFSFFIADPSPGQSQTFRLVTDAEFSQCECNGQNNEALVTIRCEEGDRPLLSISKLCPSGQAVGGIYRFELGIVNESSSDLEGVVLTDMLPRGFSYVAGSSRLDNQVFTDPEIGAQLVWRLGILGKGVSRTLVFAAVADADTDPGQYCNQARVHATRAGETLILQSNLAECCTVVVTEPDPGCCLELEVEPLGAWRIPPQALVKPTYRFETAPAMLTVFGSLDLWRTAPPAVDSYPWLVQQRLKQFALATVLEHYQRSTAGVLDDGGLLKLSYAASNPLPLSDTDRRWNLRGADQTFTPSQLARELLALDQAILAEVDPAPRRSLEQMFDHRFRFMTKGGEGLPQKWIVRDKEEIKEEGTATLQDRAEVLWALGCLQERHQIPDELLRRHRIALKELDRKTIDPKTLEAELFFCLALEQRGETGLLAEKKKELLRHLDEEPGVYKELRHLALAAALFAPEEAETAQRFMKEIKARFLVAPYRLLGRRQADGAVRVVLEDLGTLLLAVHRLAPEFRGEWAGIIDAHVSGGILFIRPEGSTNLLVLGDESLPQPLPQRDETSQKLLRPAPVYVRDALILPPDYEPLPLADITRPWLQILPAEALVSSDGLAYLASELMWAGEDLYGQGHPLTRDQGQTWRYIGHRYLESLLAAASGYRSASGLFIPERKMARMGNGENLLAPDSSSRYRLEDLAALSLAERAYLNTAGRDQAQMTALLDSQMALLSTMLKQGPLPRTFFIDSMGQARIADKTPARDIDLARLAEAFPSLRSDLAEGVKENGGDSLTDEDLLFLFQHPVWISRFSRSLEAIVGSKEQKPGQRRSQDAAAKLLGQELRHESLWWNTAQDLPWADDQGNKGPSDRAFYRLSSLLLSDRLLSRSTQVSRLYQNRILLRDILAKNWHLSVAGQAQILPSERYFVDQPVSRQTALPGDRFVFRVTVDTLCLDGRPGPDTQGTYFIRGRFDRFLDDQGHAGDPGLTRLGDFRWRHDGLAPDGRFSYLGFARIPEQAPFGMLGGEFHLTRSKLSEDLWFDWSRDERCEDLERLGLMRIVPEQIRSGLVFADENGNGRRDAGEPGVAGVRVRDDLGRKVYSDADGRFSFTMGDQPRYLQLMPDSVADLYLLDARCSRWIQPEDNAEVAMPLIPQQRVTGTVYEDQNDNGIRDEAEPVLADVAVEAGSKRSFSGRDGRFTLYNTPVPWRFSLKVSQEQPLFTGRLKKVKIETEK